MESYDYTIKVILLGDYGVGKTKLLDSFVRFQDSSPSCCCVIRHHHGYAEIQLQRDKRNILVKLIDTEGQERYRSLTSSYYRGANGCILMYDVTAETTFENLHNWFDDMNNYGSHEMPVILAGSRCLADDRVVSRERGEKFAEHMHVPHVEVDSASNHNVMSLLEDVVDLVVAKLSKSPYDEPSTTTLLYTNRQTKGKSWCNC
ncbi:ras-related protein Rab-3C-like [Gigantopelta aegis]|uniref:ras-related protein Rab-3C-like n=1 Tax=Gigantopelta aegis TaxID=1735272 RepID=UPI001B88B2B9|nr:ras-related protein Rab-3C-like [Gigantopelta aegis]